MEKNYLKQEILDTDPKLYEDLPKKSKTQTFSILNMNKFSCKHTDLKGKMEDKGVDKDGNSKENSQEN